jgi:hypothetical protein
MSLELEKATEKILRDIVLFANPLRMVSQITKQILLQKAPQVHVELHGQGMYVFCTSLAMQSPEHMERVDVNRIHQRR